MFYDPGKDCSGSRGVAESEIYSLADSWVAISTPRDPGSLFVSFLICFYILLIPFPISLFLFFSVLLSFFIPFVHRFRKMF